MDTLHNDDVIMTYECSLDVIMKSISAYVTFSMFMVGPEHLGSMDAGQADAQVQPLVNFG